MTGKDTTTRFNRALHPLWTLDEAIKKRGDTFGKTDLFSTGDPIIDEYIGGCYPGGYGRKNGYEVVLIFGDTGCNKSTFASSLIIEPAKKGHRIAYFALEDEDVDVGVRLQKQCKDEATYKIVEKNIDFTTESFGYTLSDLAKFVKDLFDTYDIVVIDPLQFAFEASVVESGESEFNRQRLFMRQLEVITREAGKTAIVVSHTRKGSGKGQDEGLDRIIGSSGIAQGVTKAIEINRKDGVPGIRIWKNRFAKLRNVGHQIRISDDMRICSAFDIKELTQIRESWGEPQGFKKWHESKS